MLILIYGGEACNTTVVCFTFCTQRTVMLTLAKVLLNAPLNDYGSDLTCWWENVINNDLGVFHSAVSVQRPRYTELRFIMNQVPDIHFEALEQFDQKTIQSTVSKAGEKKKKEQFKRLIAGTVGVWPLLFIFFTLSPVLITLHVIQLFSIFDNIVWYC